ncbi:hypothetical protein UlMin_021480 [Ulmus minor]
MNKEQEEIQFLGIFDIYKEAYKIIFSWRKVDLHPIFLAHIQVSEFLFRRIIRNEIILDETKVGTPKYKKLSDHISSEWTNFWLFKVAYFTFLLIFSLLSTSAVVYTVASIYTGHEVTFNKIVSVVPKVWKRLMVTFVWAFIAFFAYNTLALIVLFATLYSIKSTYNADLVIGIILLVIYLVGFVYLSLVWQLASVVSVLEDARGIEAMEKSKTLIKGKMWVAILVISKLIISVFLLQFAFQNLVVHGWSLEEMDRVGYAIIFLLVLLKLIIFGLVIQTIHYFVCKSYHHENIDKLALSDHLEVYLGDYVPLKAKDVQLQQFDV